MITAYNLLQAGGHWLGATRAWMQIHKHNGSTVTWDSAEVLQPPMTVRDVEAVAAEAAAAERARVVKVVETLALPDETKELLFKRIRQD